MNYKFRRTKTGSGNKLVEQNCSNCEEKDVTPKALKRLARHDDREANTD
jgi:hypothetical protein